MTRSEILKILNKENVAFLRLWFTDIMGHNKNVEVPSSQFAKALDGQIMFDGSSINGFARIEESDMLLAPDYNSFRILPWSGVSKVARIICDIKKPDGSSFLGCPRSTLKKVCERAKKLGLVLKVGPEAEFFLFQRAANGDATTKTNDAGGYFDQPPIDLGEDCRLAIVNSLQNLNFEVEAAHHEVAMGQHEIDFKYDDVLITADNLITFRFVVRKVALDFNLHATFMPKPLYGHNGSGMHTHQSLFTFDNQNAFFDPKTKTQISSLGLNYIGGLLEHARGFCAVTNPLVNSYKRLVKGYEAPTHIVWSEKNRSPLVRVPDRRGEGTRAELRSPDPACNPYLAFAVMFAAGLDGINNKLDPGPPINRNIYDMSFEEREKLKIKSLPNNLNEAINCMEADALVKETLGKHIFEHFVVAKRKEWAQYTAQVHPWEIDEYLSRY